MRQHDLIIRVLDGKSGHQGPSPATYKLHQLGQVSAFLRPSLNLCTVKSSVQVNDTILGFSNVWLDTLSLFFNILPDK